MKLRKTSVSSDFRMLKFAGNSVVKNDGGRIPLGSQGLIHVASFAERDYGWDVMEFMMVDSRLDAISLNKSHEISRRMIRILRAYGVDELDEAMRDDFKDMYVLSVTLKCPLTGNSLSLGRDASVDKKEDFVLEFMTHAVDIVGL